MASLKVLIAEDDRPTRMVLERSVVAWGHTFVSAGDGEAARELLKTHIVDVCILDWEMPNLSGVELCKWLRSSADHEKTHVILTTSKGRPEDIQTGYEAGANDYHTKPTNLKYLQRQLTMLAEKLDMVEATERSEGKLDTLAYFAPDFLFSHESAARRR